MFQYRPGAWVGQVRQPEFDGVAAGLRGELVSAANTLMFEPMDRSADVRSGIVVRR